MVSPVKIFKLYVIHLNFHPHVVIFMINAFLFSLKMPHYFIVRLVIPVGVTKTND